MKRLFVIAGIALTLLPLGASAEEKSLYQRIMEQVQNEHAVISVDDQVLTFVRLAVQDDWDLTNDEIEEIVRGYGWKICGGKPDQPIGQSSAECTNMISTVNRIAKDQQTIRKMGRTLQSIATGYELPLSDLPDRALRLSADLQGIVNIWSAGTGSIQSKQKLSAIRTVSVPGDQESGIEDVIEEIARILNDLDEEQRVAAVWRYSQGARLVRDDRSPEYLAPPIPNDPSEYEDTERQFLFKRWDELEDELLELLGDAAAFPIDPPLTSSETAYVLLPQTMLSERMPDNIIVWIRLHGDNGNNNPLQDAGLEWSVPLEPVMPSLKKDDEDEPILGGEYPPAPESPDPETTPEGFMLCTGPGMLRGYLCRPVPPSIEKKCPEPRGNGDNIQLVTCTDTGSLALRYTTASADVCREITWKKPETFDPITHCRINLRCASSCSPVPTVEGLTGTKQNNGTIDVCIENNTTGPATYLVYHELAHAYQLCDKPPETTYEEPAPNASPEEREKIRARNTERCCSMESEAFRMQCEMMEHDGLFEGAGEVDGIPINAQTCSDYAANNACGQRDGFNGCPTLYAYTQGFLNRLNAVGDRNPQNVPVTCSASINPSTIDPRVKALKDLIERRDDVCRPDNVTEYKNRIGNNLCYIGQCVEQSVELHRMTPGRRPATIGDMAAPWNDPTTGTPLGNLLTSPVVTDDTFPVYQPHLLVRTLDGALCQSVGLPAISPSILCLVEASRQLELTRESGLQTAIGLLGQNLEQQEDLRDLSELARGIGARAGTELYGNYLRNSTRALADIIGMANTLLKQLENVEFPAQMCPTDPGLPEQS